jgi:hypothetical protein
MTFSFKSLRRLAADESFGWSTWRLWLPMEEGGEALVFLEAGGASVQMGLYAGHGGLRVGSCELELDVAVQLREAHLACHLGLAGSQQTA